MTTKRVDPKRRNEQEPEAAKGTLPELPPGAEDVRILELKRKKLQLKDEMAAIGMDPGVWQNRTRAVEQRLFGRLDKLAIRRAVQAARGK
jgi:hypothetical protein